MGVGEICSFGDEIGVCFFGILRAAGFVLIRFFFLELIERFCNGAGFCLRNWRLFGFVRVASCLLFRCFAVVWKILVVYCFLL